LVAYLVKVRDGQKKHVLGSVRMVAMAAAKLLLARWKFNDYPNEKSY
jgi:hypothetical protein